MKLWQLRRAAPWRSRTVRGRRAQAVAPVHYNLFVEGTSDAPHIGDFRGFAHAVVVGERSGAADASYLVVDPGKPAPVWVRSDEVTSLQRPAHRGSAMRRDANDAPARGEAPFATDHLDAIHNAPTPESR
jgi:hypothetical protein